MYIDVEPVGFNRGFYTVDVRYYYRVTADAFVGAARPVEVSGLCVFDKRVILFGSEGTAKIFSSQTSLEALDEQLLRQSNLPTAVVEATAPKQADPRPPRTQKPGLRRAEAGFFQDRPSCPAADVGALAGRGS